MIVAIHPAEYGDITTLEGDVQVGAEFGLRSYERQQIGKDLSRLQRTEPEARGWTVSKNGPKESN
jgi:hypothetical protein